MRPHTVILASLVLLVRISASHAQEGSHYIRDLGPNSPVIVFVHGVMGDAKSTWTNGTSYWPELITQDNTFSGVSVYVHEYDTELLKGGLNINELAQNMRLHLDDNFVVNHKEIIFLAHSMGGLIVRDYLLSHREIAAKTRFIYFFSTPTTGSEIASWASLVSRNPQFRFMKPLQSDEYLGEKDREWHEARLDQIPSYCAYEKETTNGNLIVSQASATHLCNQAVDAIEANHITIVKPANQSATSYIAFRNAFRKTPSRVTGVPDNCSPTTSVVNLAGDAAKIPSLVCAGKQSGLRIRYLWLDAEAASYLISGSVKGDAAKALGGNPFVIKNAVTDEISKIVARFGTLLRAQPEDKVIVNVGAGDRDDEKNRVFGAEPLGPFLKKQGGTIKRYVDHDNEGEFAISLPDVDAYLWIQNKTDFPANYSICYEDNQTKNPLDNVVLWRFLEKEDLDSYAVKTAKMRDLVLSKSLRFDLGNLGRTLKHQSPGIPAAIPRSVAAMQYFTRAGMPRDFAVAYGTPSENIPGCGTSSYEIVFVMPQMFVLVAVIENMSSSQILPISLLKGEAIDTDRLRHREEDGGWSPAQFDFSPGSLASGESIAIPLEIELRDNKNAIRNLDAEEIKKTFEAIQRDGRREFTEKSASGAIIHKKTKAALKAPTNPYPAKYTYGPRIRLISAISGVDEIKLRPFDPSHLYLRFGIEGGSCPTILVYPVEGGPPLSYGTILAGAVTPSRARLDVLEHDGPASSIELNESEPEITTVNMLKVYSTDAYGEEHLIFQESHRNIMPGAPMRISLPEMFTATRIRVEVAGFYQPMSVLLFSERNGAGRTYSWH